MSRDVVRAGVDRALARLQTEEIDLLQFRWWSFLHSGWLDAMRELARLKDEWLIGHLGTTNFDTDHMYVLV